MGRDCETKARMYMRSERAENSALIAVPSPLREMAARWFSMR